MHVQMNLNHALSQIVMYEATQAGKGQKSTEVPTQRRYCANHEKRAAARRTDTGLAQ